MSRTLHHLRPIAFGLAVLVAVFVAGAVAMACPTCSDSLAENDAAGGNLGAGISYSVIFMISVPYLILGTFCTFAYRSVKRAAAERAAQASGEPQFATLGRGFMPQGERLLTPDS